MSSDKTYGSVGFFGAPNLGDELLARAIVDTLRRLRPEHLAVLHTFNARTTRQFALAGQERSQILQGWWPYPDWLKSLARRGRSCGLLIGGGGLLEDVYTWQSIPRYAADAMVSLVRGHAIAYVGLGVRPIRRPLLRKMATFLLGNAAAVYVRDEASVARVRGMAPSALAFVAPDLAVLADLQRQTKTLPPYVMVNVRQTEGLTEEAAVSAARRLADEFHVKTVLLLAAETPDIVLLEQIKARLDADSLLVRVVWPRDVDEAASLVAGAAATLAMRLHVVHLALAVGGPLLAVSYEAKVDHLLDDARFNGKAVRPAALADHDGLVGTADAEAMEELRTSAEAAFARVLNDVDAAVVPVRVRLTAACWLLPMVLLSLVASLAIVGRRLLRGSRRSRQMLDAAQQHYLPEQDPLEGLETRVVPAVR